MHLTSMCVFRTISLFALPVFDFGYYFKLTDENKRPEIFKDVEDILKKIF